MFVRFIGFELTSGPSASIPDLFEKLEEDSGAERRPNQSLRYVYVKRDDEQKTAVGLIVTVKDHKSFCQFERGDGSFKIRVGRVAELSETMDYNFFYVNMETGFGLYQHYHGSCSLRTAMSFFEKDSREISSSRKKSLRESIKSLKGSKKNVAIKELKNNFDQQLGTF